MPVKKKTISKKKKTSLKVVNTNTPVKKSTSEDPFINNYLLSWEAPEFVYHSKSTIWHVSAVLVFSAVVLALIFLKEWLGIAVFLVLAFAVFRYAEVKPKNIEISLTNVGVKVGDVFYPFNKLRSFWLVYEPPIKTLNLETTKRFSPIITIQLEETDPFLVKNILKEHLLEESERTEDFVDKISRALRF